MLYALKVILLFVGGFSVGIGVAGTNTGGIKRCTNADIVLVNLGAILIIVTTLLWADVVH